MASMKDASRLTENLEQLVGELRSELENGDADFDMLVSLSDEISEHADGLAETFSNVNEALMQRINTVKNGSSRSGGRQSRSQQKAGSRS